MKKMITLIINIAIILGAFWLGMILALYTHFNTEIEIDLTEEDTEI